MPRDYLSIRRGLPHFRIDVTNEGEAASLETIEGLQSSDQKMRDLYQPLDATRHEIRLVRFMDEESGSEALRFTMQTFELDTAPAYRALSYVWGIQATRTITINGLAVRIRVNLFEFLNVFRAWEARRDWIWIDQLCINQGSIEERNNQVGMTSRIYFGAFETFAWLGADQHGLQGQALEFVRSRGELQGAAHDEPIGLEDKAALHSLCKNPYWTRHWVVQELALSKSRVLVCGQSIAPLQQVIDLHRIFAHIHLDSTTLASLCRLVEESERQRTHGGRFSDEWSMWEEAISTAVTTHCHDLRDKIYGIQSLFMPQQRIHVDYTATTSQVCIRALLAFVRTVHDSRVDRVKYWFNKITLAMDLHFEREKLWDNFIAQWRWGGETDESERVDIALAETCWDTDFYWYSPS